MIDPTDLTAIALAQAVNGQFRLEREIGRGGMGVVYLATDLQLRREVAIKTLPPHLAADAAVRDRFVREARTAAALSHPNIVPIYQAAERDGVVYFAMGYIPGDSLAEKLARDGCMSMDALAGMLSQLADALGYAHSLGVVHRDVKAENVMIDSRNGRMMITDFGIARVTEAQPLTATGNVLGTVHYMSPEQVMGETLDGRSDLYALGVLAFKAATGEFPFERSNASAVLVAHVNNAAPRLHSLRPDAPDSMDEIIARLLEKRPSDRFSDGAALRAALQDTNGSGYPSQRGVQTPLRATQLEPVERGNRQYVASPAAPVVLSSDDAQEVWARAAELQANTGLMAPPPAFALRALDVDPVTRGYDAALVRASAAEAGIDARYVDLALAERNAMAPITVEAGPVMQQSSTWFAGAKTKLEYRSSLDGELTDIGFEEIAEELRNSLGEMVSVSAVGRTLTATMIGQGRAGRHGNRPRVLQVYISSRNGKTNIRAFEDLKQIAGGLFGGIGGGFGLGMGFPVAASMLTHGQGLLGIAAGGAVMLTAYGGARAIFTYLSRKRQRELKEIVERVVQNARQHLVSGP